MKTLVENSSGLSKYMFEDAEIVTMLDDYITIGEPIEWVIGCHNSSDSTLFENITPPNDWIGNKYTYAKPDGEDDYNWVKVEGWVDPNE